MDSRYIATEYIMYIIYCLHNESLKENIVNVGLAASVFELKHIVKQVNTAFLPTPYTIFLTKNVSNPKRIDYVYTLLCKFGKHLSGSFFEISLDFIRQCFNIICDTGDTIDTNIQEKYKIVQGGTEYSIPMADDVTAPHVTAPHDTTAVDVTVSSFINDTDHLYDHLSYKSTYIDLDL